MKLISWNVNGRVRTVGAQCDALNSRAPDLVALQEVTASSTPKWRDALTQSGLTHVVDSFELAPDLALLRGPRRYGQLIACRFPLSPLAPGEFDIPWPERVLSTTAHVGSRPIDVHTTHIPPGSSNGWIKIETLEGIFRRLSIPAVRDQILCGDFNLPQHESEAGEVFSWGFRERRSGVYGLKRGRERWDAGERGVLLHLAGHGLPDVYRMLHGYGKQDYSWFARTKGIPRGRRFDHVFASAALDPATCEYLDEFRVSGLSDHAAIEVVFMLGG